MAESRWITTAWNESMIVVTTAVYARGEPSMTDRAPVLLHHRLVKDLVSEWKLVRLRLWKAEGTLTEPLSSIL